MNIKTIKKQAQEEFNNSLEYFIMNYNDKMIDYLIGFYNSMDNKCKDWHFCDVMPLDHCDEYFMDCIRDDLGISNVWDYIASVWEDMPNIIAKKNREKIAYKMAVLGE